MGVSLPRDWHLTRQEWLLSLLLLLCYGYFLPRYADWNQSSRVALILAIAEEGRLAIDSYAWSTGDYAEFRGHRYSDKAPTPALLGVPVYAAAKQVLAVPWVAEQLGRAANSAALLGTLRQPEAPGEKIRFALASIVVTWVVITVPAALLGICLYRMLAELGFTERTRLVVTLSYALATSAFPYAGNFYSHQLSATALFVSFYLLWRATSRGRAVCLAVGTLLAVALTSEYSTALVVGPLLLYALSRVRPLTRLSWIAAGMLPPLMIMSIYNVLIFESPLPVGYAYSALWLAEHGTGFFSLTVPHPGTLLELTFGTYRGLFFVSPILLIAVAGFYPFARSRQWRAELALCAWAVTSFLLFNSASVMPFGGFAVGPRYLVPMLPFLCLPLAFAIKRWGELPRFRTLFCLLIVWSASVIIGESIAGQSFPGYELNPFWEVSLPALVTGNIARNWGTLLGLSGWVSLAPLAVAVASIAIQFRLSLLHSQLGLAQPTPGTEPSSGVQLSTLGSGRVHG
jgi:hypothetical protein